VRTVFKKSLRILWDKIPEVPDRLLAAIDGSFIEIGPSAEGAGTCEKTCSRTKKVRTSEGMKTVKRTVIGFKMMVL